MGTCSSTPSGMVIDPVIEDSLKRNRNSFEEKDCISNFVCTTLETDTYDDYDKERIQLYEAVYQRSWSKVTEFMESEIFMQSADYVDRYKRTCLHWACIKSAPLPILQNLIVAYGDAILMQDLLGKTPLHLACEFGSHASIYLLLEVSSEVTSVRDTENGRTPLAESIICHRPPLVIQYLLDSNPRQIIIPDKKGNTPVVTFFMINLGLFMSFTGKAKGTWACCNDSVEDLIKTARLLLLAENQELDNSTKRLLQPQDDLNENKSGNILHNAIMTRFCPLAFVEFLLSFFPELADGANRAGDLPIHVAAALIPDSSKEQLQIYKCNECGKSQSKDAAHYYRRDPKVHFRQLLCHDCISKDQICDYKKNSSNDKIVATIKVLLSINPDFVQMTNRENLTPLDIAIKSGHSWNEIMGVCDEISTTPTCQVETISNNERSLLCDLETTVENNHLIEHVASEPIIYDDTSQASLSTVAQDSTSVRTENSTTNASTKSLIVEPSIDNDSLEESLQSTAHASKCTTEDVDVTIDDLSQASSGKLSATTRNQCNFENEMNAPTCEDKTTTILVKDESITDQLKSEPITDPLKGEPSTNSSEENSIGECLQEHHQ